MSGKSPKLRRLDKIISASKRELGNFDLIGCTSVLLELHGRLIRVWVRTDDSEDILSTTVCDLCLRW